MKTTQTINPSTSRQSTSGQILPQMGQTFTEKEMTKIINKLNTTDKAKTREEGILLLNHWLANFLESEILRRRSFVEYLDRHTSLLQPNGILDENTWPYLVKLLMTCVKEEIKGSKRRAPKLMYAKTLRAVVDCALSNRKYLPLIAVTKLLFNHIWDVLKDVPTFHHEYGAILQQLLEAGVYCFHMRKGVYCGLVLFYVEKVEAIFSQKQGGYSILVLHALLANPPGDFPENLREDVVKGFIGIFSSASKEMQETKTLQKLFECLNVYLLNDGPNLGDLSLEIHDSIIYFVSRDKLWKHKDHKDNLFLYARLQLNLSRDNQDGGPLLETLFEVVISELELQSDYKTSTIASRSEPRKDEEFGTWNNFLELAALVLYRACAGVHKFSSPVKRARTQDVVTLVREGLMEGKFAWHAAFSRLCRNYGTRMDKNLFTFWFDGIFSTLDRTLSDANVKNSYDGLWWTLRSLGELFMLLMPLYSTEVGLPKRPSLSTEIATGWKTVWNTLVRGLPTFSNNDPIADAAFRLLGNMVLNDRLNLTVPQDMWDLQFFKLMHPGSCLYFISCYFSRSGLQGDLRDDLHHRQFLLRAVVSSFKSKDIHLSKEPLAMLFPAAIYAVCAGVCMIHDYSYGVSVSHENSNVAGAAAERLLDNRLRGEECEFFVNILSEVNIDAHDNVPTCSSQGVRLPRQLRDPLLQEIENCCFDELVETGMEKHDLSDIFSRCALLSYLIHGSFATRIKDSILPFYTKLSNHLLDLVDCATSKVQESLREKGSLRTRSIDFFKDFLSSPYFSSYDKDNALDSGLHCSIILSIERLLKTLCSVYAEFSNSVTTLPSETAKEEVSAPCSPILPDSSKSTEYDAELDFSSKVDEEKAESAKMSILSLISCCFLISPEVTWDVLFEILKTESSLKGRRIILQSLCQNLYVPSSVKLTDLVRLIDEMTDLSLSLRLPCSDLLFPVCRLLSAVLSLHSTWKGENGGLSFKERCADQCLQPLGDLVNKLSESNLLDRDGRVKLVGCICDLICINPLIGQDMIQKLLLLLRDPDYRVRISLARRIGILFSTWDGHADLFLDICSSFGLKLVMSSKQKFVTAKEVLATGCQNRPTMETIVITLMHIAFHSEKMELEAVFMVCVISAINPSQRELAKAVFHNLSRQLKYPCASKYLEELMAPILFSWVGCGVSLIALVEIRDLFVSDVEPNLFMLYCCKWLLPALILHDDSTNLQWVAGVTGQSVSALVRSHFVPIFSVCMVLHCSKNSDRDKGSAALQSRILLFAKITEDERDGLIKKNMVAIVCQMLSLTSSTSETTLPWFSRENVELAIRTVVDGFLEMENYQTNLGVVDKINVFRPDRVFKLLVELHYKVTSAINQRHKSHRLAGIEVLLSILGYRAAVASTSCYLFNLVGQFISCQVLQDQCCRMISMLLTTFKSNPSDETTRVLGEQLQFLVSKLVACCVPLDAHGESACTPSLQVFSLLHLLTVDADPSLHDYIREFEPFPELHVFDRIRSFHLQLCRDYSPRDHFLKFATRSCHLPPRLLLWSLQALHRKLLLGEIFQVEDEESGAKDDYWHSDPVIVQAVWSLIRICGSEDADNARALVSDFISKVGIGDPRAVVFHLPGDSSRTHVFGEVSHIGVSDNKFLLDTVVPDELLVALIRILKKYLMDESVNIVDLSSQTLHGILSTESGDKVMRSFDTYERSLLEVHSKGVNMQLVESVLCDMQKKFTAESKSLEDSSLWSTSYKTFESWICPLVYSLVGHCNDVTLRLCQDLVLLKAEIAELLLPSIMVDLSRRKDTAIDFCKLISLQVVKHIFIGTNKLIKSIQVMLDAMNELRLCHVMERTASAAQTKQNLKFSRSSSGQSAKSRVSTKSLESAISGGAVVSTTVWDKVFWLTIDYLIVAKSAIFCGSYFTAVMYVEHWCEDNFNNLTLGEPDFSHVDMLPNHIEILLSALTHINEPDSLYGIIQSHKLTSQIITYEHEGNWSKAFEYYDLLLRTKAVDNTHAYEISQAASMPSEFESEQGLKQKKLHKGVIRSLQQIGCAHTRDLYCEGLVSRRGELQHDVEFVELQYEAAWRAGNWDFSLFYAGNDDVLTSSIINDPFNQNLHGCMRALHEGDGSEFFKQLTSSKQGLVLSLSHASEERTEYIYSTMVKLQILDHLGMAWNLRWTPMSSSSTSHKQNLNFLSEPAVPTLNQVLAWNLRWTPMSSSSTSHKQNLNFLSEPAVPTLNQLARLNAQWNCILKQTQSYMNYVEPFVAFRRVLLQTLSCRDSTLQDLLQCSSVLRKGSMFSQAAAFLHEFKSICMQLGGVNTCLYWLGRVEEAKLLRAQGQQQMAINLGKYVAEHSLSKEESSDVHRLVGKWLAETRSSNSRTILEKYLKPAVSFAEEFKTVNRKSSDRKCQTHYHLAHYADALFRSHEERLTSSEWQAAMRLRKHKKMELEALIKRLKSSTKGEKVDYSIKIQELQKQLAVDTEEAEKLQDDRDNFLTLALEGYKRCLVIGDRYDVRVVFRLVSLWFGLSSRQNVISSMVVTVKEVQSYKFIPLVYQIASRLGSAKEVEGPNSFQFALTSLLKKLAVDHPYHTIFQLLALSNGDRIKDKQRSRNSFVVDIDKKLSAEKLLKELSAYHGNIIRQMKQMVEIYIRLAELETKREDTNKRINLPRDIRSVRELELVPVVTSNVPIDPSCQYHEGTFPHFKGLADSIVVMNGINAPKVVDCHGSDGKSYRQLAKSGNDDLRQDAVMEQCFGLVNTFLHNNRDTWKRKLGVRTYKVVPFTPSAGVIEWVDGTVPLGEYLIGSSRNGGAHGRYGIGDWSFAKCREHMMNAKDKRKAFQEVYENFRPVMHHFFLERFLKPADWFEKRLAYARSVAASSMVGYIVGLGDRHSMNILIDQATAEVVHIDLGVAFEQGLMLKTPERVPFRLTRDIVDGMGVTGVEGVFRRCCEETLSVMRTNKAALLTIIEVFIHDPLYKWALSPLKALQRQKETDDDMTTSWEDSQDEYEGNKDAARALIRVKQKLDGYEDGEMRSVHGQVQQLIQDAIDQERLCHMFPGWGAWM